MYRGKSIRFIQKSRQKEGPLARSRHHVSVFCALINITSKFIVITDLCNNTKYIHVAALTIRDYRMNTDYCATKVSSAKIC